MYSNQSEIFENDKGSKEECDAINTLIANSATKNLFDAAENIKNSVNKYNLFKFDECVRFKQDNNEGKYCMLAYTSGDDGSELRYTGVCYPSSCSDAILRISSEKYLKENSKTLADQWCHASNLNFEIRDYLAIAFFSLWAIIVIFSTIYDYVMKINKKQITKKWLITFSLCSNVTRVFQLGDKASDINCLYALRVLSVFWLIIANRFRSMSTFPLYDDNNFSRWQSNIFSAFIGESDVAYDTFFMVSGFLLATYCLRAFSVQSMNYIHLLVHRYMRYMPLLIVSIIYYASFFKFFVVGPLSYRLDTRVENCQNYWWTTVLLVENYVNPSNVCLYDGWYFNVDFQFFIIVPLLVFIFFKYRTVGTAILLTIIIGIYTSVITLLIVYDTPYTIINRISTLPLQSHFRCAPWIISIFLASFCLKDKDVQMKKTTRTLCWIGTYTIFIVHFVYIYLLQNKEYAAEILPGAIFAGIHRIMWSVAIGWIIFACVKLETDGLVHKILNWNGWKPFGKLSLSLLIIHPLYQMSTAYTMKVAYDFNSWWTFHAALGDIFFTTILSIFLYASIEIPFIKIEQSFHEKLKKIRNDANENENESQIEQAV